MRHGFPPTALASAFPLCFAATPAATEILFQDEHGARVEYRATDTGQSTSPYASPEADIQYNIKKTTVWPISLNSTNGLNPPIRPDGTETTHLNVEPERDRSLGYCAYEGRGNFHRVDGRADQCTSMFGITLGVVTISRGRTNSDST